MNDSTAIRKGSAIPARAANPSNEIPRPRQGVTEGTGEVFSQ